MYSITTVLFILFAGIFFYTGVNYLLNIRGYKKDYLFILYGLMCIFSSGYAFSSIFVYHLSDVASNIAAVKFQSTFARLIMVILPWFIGLYANFIPKRLLAAISILAFMLGAAKLVLPDSFIFPNLTGIHYLITPWGEHLMDLSCDLCPLTYVLYAVYLALMIFGAEATRRLLKRGKKSQAWPFIFPLSFAVVAFVNDVLLDAGAIRSMYLEEYAIFIFILVIGSWMNAQRMHAEGNYRALFHSVNDAIFVHDALTGKVLDVNEAAARMFGATSQDLISGDFKRTCAETPPYTMADALVLVHQAAAKGPQVYEWRSRRVDDSRLFHTEVSLRSDVIDDRPVVLAAVRDISKRKKAEEEKEAIESQLQQAQKLESLGLLAGSVAHDFNNLLMVILGNAALAHKDLPPDSLSHSHLDHIGTAAQRAASLCQQLLAYSGRGGFVIEHLGLKDVVEDITRILEVSIPKKIQLNLRYDPDLPRILADATQIRQVVMNLITNAAEAIGDGEGIITLSTFSRPMDRAAFKEYMSDPGLPEGPYVALKVADTGCGMDEKTVARVFEPFFTTKFTGRGLGMAVVLGIVRGHKGAIRINSEMKKGTTVTVLFPIAPEGVQNIAPAPKAPPSPPAAREMVLLVDDDKPVLMTVAKLVEMLGHRTLTAESGRKALEIFKKQHGDISCVLLDLTMPDMDGGETLQEMKRIDPKARVVLTSGYSERDLKDRFKGQGVAGFLQKPYMLEDLKAVIESALNGSS